MLPLTIALLTFQNAYSYLGSHAATANDINFINNWLPAIPVLFLVLGWFLLHWIEQALFKNFKRVALLLFGILWLVIIWVRFK
jgi:hypothetical protein